MQYQGIELVCWSALIQACAIRAARFAELAITIVDKCRRVCNVVDSRVNEIKLLAQRKKSLILLEHLSLLNT